MPDSYRLKPYGGQRGGNRGGSRGRNAFTATRLSAEPAVPPTHSAPERAKGRTGRAGAIPRAGLVHEAPSPAPTATLRDHHATPPPSRTMCAMGSQVPQHPAPHMVQSTLGPLGPFSPPEGIGSRRRGGRAIVHVSRRGGGKATRPSRLSPTSHLPRERHPTG